MPYTDQDGNRVEKGEEVEDSAVVSVPNDATETLVTLNGLVNVTDATAKFVNPGNANAGDGINNVNISSGDSSQVGVTLVDNSATQALNLDVQVDAEGY